MNKKHKIKISLNKKNLFSKKNNKNNLQDTDNSIVSNEVIKIQDTPSMSFTHFVLTRFNIHLREFLSDSRCLWHNISEEKWTNFRLSLMEASLLRSLENQTCKNFIWLCFFDERTSEDSRKKINKMKEKVTFFYPVYVKVEGKIPNLLDQKLFESVKKTIFDLKSSDDDLILQTRIDSDNYINCNFIRHIQDCVAYNKNEKKRIITFPKGFYLSFKNKRFILWERYYPSNACITMVQQNSDSIECVWKYGHDIMIKHYPYFFVQENYPMWLTMVQHGLNTQDVFENGYLWKLTKSYIPKNYKNYENILMNDFSFVPCEVERILCVHTDNN